MEPRTVIPDGRPLIDDEDEFLEGRVIGRYRLGARIGRGGFGSVHEATESGPLARRVALKIVRAGRRGSGLDAALREARALERLTHPGIARVHEAGLVDATRAFVAMDLVEGPTLWEWARRTVPSLDERLRVFAELCEAVQFAHARGILHRDIKPSNVLMARDADGVEHPVLVDFGLAALVGIDDCGAVGAVTDGGPSTRWSESTGVPTSTLVTDLPDGGGFLAGTPEIMAPELLVARAVDSGAPFDMRTEVYALGVTLHMLVTGTLPFSRSPEESLPAFVDRIRSGCTPLAPCPPWVFAGRQVPGGVADDLRAVLSRALAADPETRYGSVAGLGSEVRRLRRGEPTEACGDGIRPRLRRGWHAHGRAAVIVTILLGASVSTGWLAVAESEARRESDRLRTEQSASLASLEAANIRANEAVTAVGDTLMSVLREFRVLATSRQLADTMPKVVEAFAAVYGTDDKRTNSQRLFLSEAQLAAYRWPEAEASLRALEAYALARLPESHPSVMRIRRGLVEALEGQGRTSEAIALLRTLLGQVPSLDSPCNGVVHPFYLHVLLGELLIAEGGCEEGVGELETALQQAIECTGQRSRNALTATVSLGIGLARCGRDDEAVTVLDDGIRLGEALGRRSDSAAAAEAWTVRARCHAALLGLRRLEPGDARASLCERLVRDLTRWDELRGLNEEMRRPFIEALAREGVEWMPGAGAAQGE